MQAIKAYELSHGIPFEEMPSNFAFFGDDGILDLRPWSIIVSDKTMHTIAQVCRIYQDCSRRALQLPPEQAQDLLKPSLRTLLVTKTGQVTDTGLKAVVDACHTLVHLDLSHVTGVTDVGIREVAIACANTLHVFKLSGNSHLRGEGLAVVGECCTVLKELHLSRCTGLKEWALSKLWHGCGRLMVINLSHCAQLGDQCIREMAAGCPLLRHIDLEEVQQVSDVGVLAISQHCRDLETLNLSRTNLLFKITDVGMLALGERCPMLQELKLVNCNCVTDVGLNWLALGCVALRYLDLSGCTKVGNPEHCHALEFLNLKDACLSTDVGVKHLSQGCTHLTSLNLSGIYLISDGVKRDFGAEGLAALSQGCSKLKHLQLSGCFRVSKLALKAMGKGLAALEKISLAYCTSLTEVGLADLFRGCRALSHVDLTECGSCVTDKALVELAHCHMLKSLLLKAADRVSAVGIKALARHCKAIETLDLSGCVGIDDLAILPLTEADFQPGLKCLMIDGCVKVTDTGLAWLADACPTIITLSCKGSGVSVRALHAVRESWCWSSVRKTEEELGVFPFSRLADRRFIHQHATRYRAATKITALVRGYLGRLRCDGLRLDRHKAWVATVVQSLVRRCMAIKLVTRLRREVMRKHLCATAVQCMYRCWKARRCIDERRAHVLLILRTKVATELQRVWRGLLGRRRVQRIREQARVLRSRQQHAAINIQRVYKGFLARRVVRDLRKRRTKERQRRLRATLLIQRVIRGHFSRLRTCRLRAERDRVARLRLSCAVKLERVYRGHLGRRRVAALRQQQSHKQRVVLWVQKHWRGYAARQEFESLLQHVQLEGEERAAVVVQKYWRRGLAYLELRRLLHQRSQRQALMANRAYFIQRIYRGYCARNRVRMLLAEKARWKELGAKLELHSALRIQASIRRFHAQSRFRRLKAERKGRWKELLDDKSGRRFFYNKVSGEVRWRTPQDVLDLQPRPGCGDCNFFEAAMECAHCAEFFCNGCWKRVHGGGKRAGHEFRVLFDYYGKRIDYGEGEFPSRWPSDMHQDELNGWRLHVYPSRQPTALLEGEWEEYRDEKDPNGRPLYYNRLTGASTYDLPDALSLPASTQPLSDSDGQLTTYSQPNGSWLEYFDHANQLTYWYDPCTNMSTYSRPLELQLTPPAALEYGDAASSYAAPSAAASGAVVGVAEAHSWRPPQNDYIRQQQATWPPSA